jgi:cytochrome c oxidase assembly factor CtaG
VSPHISWTLEPVVLIAIAAALWLYVPRWRTVRAEHGARGAGRWRLASFIGGLLAIFAALISPIDSISDDLFVIHMIQHVLLLDIAPILLICGQTKLILRPVTRRLRHVEESAGWFGRPSFAVAFYVGAVWFWHVPALYDAALSHPPVHVLEHVSYALAGGLYWWHLLSPIRSRHRLDGMGPAVYMAATKLCLGVLGIVLVFAPHALYGFYSHRSGYWGLGAHTDQELAGGVMALEQSLVMGIALTVIFMRMLRDSEREARRAERLLDSQEAADDDARAAEAVTLGAGPEALEDPGVPGDRSDQDRVVGDPRAGEDDRVAQADTVAEGRAIADHDGPVESDVGADPDVVADPDRQ